MKERMQLYFVDIFFISSYYNNIKNLNVVDGFQIDGPGGSNVVAV